MIYSKSFCEDKQIETTETNFEYDNQGRVHKRTVTTTTNINTPSACANCTGDGVLLEDCIELSAQSAGERVLQALTGLAAITSIAASVYAIYKKLCS